MRFGEKKRGAHAPSRGVLGALAGHIARKTMGSLFSERGPRRMFSARAPKTTREARVLPLFNRIDTA